MRAADTYKPDEGSMHTWLSKILVNLFVDKWRRSQNRPVTEYWDYSEKPLESPAPEHRKPVSHFEYRDEFSSDIDALLDHLAQYFPEEVIEWLREYHDRMNVKTGFFSFVLRDIFSWSYNWIADELDIPFERVKVQIHRARKVLGCNTKIKNLLKEINALHYEE